MELPWTHFVILLLSLLFTVAAVICQTCSKSLAKTKEHWESAGIFWLWYSNKDIVFIKQQLLNQKSILTFWIGHELKLNEVQRGQRRKWQRVQYLPSTIKAVQQKPNNVRWCFNLAKWCEMHAEQSQMVWVSQAKTDNKGPPKKWWKVSKNYAYEKLHTA